MSKFENSFASEQDTPTRPKRHSLCQELQQLGDKFQPDLINTSNFDTESQDNSIIAPTSLNKLQSQPDLELPKDSGEQEGAQGAQGEQEVQEFLGNGDSQPDFQEKNSGSPGGNSLEIPKEEGQVEEEGVGRIQENVMGRDSFSVSMSSRLSQYSSEVDNQSFATFLTIRDTTYSSLLKNFQLLFTNFQNMSLLRLQTLSTTYLQFLQSKLHQQQSYQSQSLPLTQNNKNNHISIDCKSLSDAIAININGCKNKRKQYIEQLREICEDLERCFEGGRVGLGGKGGTVGRIWAQIQGVLGEMESLMVPINRKNNKSKINAQIYNSAYIRTKYLMSKQKIYLSLISKYLKAVLAFITYVCFELEPKNCLVVKESMLAYVEAMSEIQVIPDSLRKCVEALNSTNCFLETYQQLCKILQLCIPDSLKPVCRGLQTSAPSQQKLKQTLQNLISQTQNLIYMPVIQLSATCYKYHSKTHQKQKIKWLKINHQQKYKSQVEEQHDTHVILTNEGDLILELVEQQQGKQGEQGGQGNQGKQGKQGKQEKMAILKVKNIKFVGKENRVYLKDQGGVLGYIFAGDQVLGSLLFQDQGKANQFLDHVKILMEELKDKKIHKKITNAFT